MIRQLTKYYKPHMKLFLLDMFFAFLIAAIDLIFPMLSRDVVSEIIPSANMALLLRFTIIAVVLYILRMYCTYFIAYYGHMMGARIEYDMKNELFDHMQKLHHKYFDKTRTGQIMNRFTGDLFEISEMTHHGPEDFFISIVMLVGGFVLLLTIDVPLTLIMYVVVLLLVWFAYFRRTHMSRAFKAQKATAADLNAKLENSVSGIRLAKAFCNEEFEKERFDEYNLAYYESKDEAYRQMGIFASINGFLTDLLNLSVMSFGGYFVYRGWINVGDLVAFILFANFMLKPIRRLMDFVQQWQQGMAGFERFIEIMKVDPEIQDKSHAKALTHLEGKITFKNVDFRYSNEDEYVLKNFDLTINKGETVALVGSSGVGKTTIAHLIPRFYEIESGVISIDDQDIQSLTLQSLRSRIGFVGQDVLIFYGTIEDNIGYGNPLASFEEIVSAAKKANIHEFIEGLDQGYQTIVGERGIMLSGGQKQRLSIARLFLKNPDILILDEATSALDNENEAIVQSAIEALAKGRTSLIIAHRLSTIRGADRIVVMDQGGITEQGTHQELIDKKGAFFRFYDLQKNVISPS